MSTYNSEDEFLHQILRNIESNFGSHTLVHLRIKKNNWEIVACRTEYSFYIDWKYFYSFAIEKLNIIMWARNTEAINRTKEI